MAGLPFCFWGLDGLSSILFLEKGLSCCTGSNPSCWSHYPTHHPFAWVSFLRFIMLKSVSLSGGDISALVPSKGSREQRPWALPHVSFSFPGPSLPCLLSHTDPKRNASFGMCVLLPLAAPPSVAWHLGTSCRSD